MLRKISSILGSSILCLGIVIQVSAQNRVVAAPASTESSDREKDGLLGPVRRVTVETAKVTFKNGSPVEGPRVLRAVMTYDPRGNKIDSLAYPVEGTSLPGKETYKYDDKGNIVEMELRGTDGAILSKELYKYVLDELGNWKQMTTSLAVFEDGKLSDEPVEVTYRTISYFYNQTIAKLTATNAANSRKTASDSASTVPVKTVKPTIMEAPPVEPPPPSNVEGRIQPKIEETKNANTSPDTAAVKVPEAAPKVTEAPTASAPLVKHVSEEVLRKAAVSLPQPTYPEAAELARVHGRVAVDVVVDEQGNVTKARANSGQPLLNDAAETAAKSARFEPSGLSTERAQVTGTITYEFVLPKPDVEAISTGPSEKKNVLPAPTGTTTGEKVSLVTARPPTPTQPISDTTQSSMGYYNVGVSFLDAGKPIEAVEALNQAVYKDPENAGAYAKLGIAYVALQKPKDAVAVFKMALRIRKDSLDAESYYQLGLAYTAVGKNSDALNAFKQALYTTRAEGIDADAAKSKKAPTAEELHYSLGLAYHNLGRFEDAVKELNQVIALNPKLAAAYYGLAVCYISMRDRKSAEKQQKILSSLNPELANRISQALATNTNLPPGLNDGMLGNRRRQ
ncbi:MAG TPA: TonB family protein [Pyrinomonadaceae bacterium]